MAKKAVINSEEQEWRTERDMHTLMDYSELLKDKARLKKAKELAKKKASELSSLLNINNKED